MNTPGPSQDRTPPPKATPVAARRRWRRLAWVAGGLLLSGLVLSQAGPVQALRVALRERSPQELIRHAEKRLQGHPRLEALSARTLGWLRLQFERPIPAIALPDLGKGQRSRLVPLSADALPLDVDSEETLRRTLMSAQPGAVIRLLPGRYRIDRTLYLGHEGLPGRPVSVTALDPGSTVLEFSQIEGVLVDKPYWQFLNLHIKGVCTTDAACEHAFHVTGKGHHFLLQNSRIEDFNAQLKVNGVGRDFPDDGRVLGNTLVNTHARQIGLPLTLIDIVGASRWAVEDNLLSNTSKTGGDQLSYAAYMKGGGEDGRFERNLVLCTMRDISAPGARVGLSFGGGTTGAEFCRHGSCSAGEHRRGLIANNIIAHCNDYGIDLNRATEARVFNNTLINTGGIDARGEPSDAWIYANLMDGGIRARDGARPESQYNESTSLSRVFTDPDRLDLSWSHEPQSAPTLLEAPTDFCAQARAATSAVGAQAQPTPCPDGTKRERPRP